MKAPPRKLGLIAGGGNIPAQIRDVCRQQGRPLYIAALNGFCDAVAVAGTDHGWFDLPQVGAILKALKSAGVSDVCLCGSVTKPDFAKLRPDWRGAMLLPKLVKAALSGDDAVLRVIVDTLEQDGFSVVGVESIIEDILVVGRQYGSIAPDAAALADMKVAIAAARKLGAEDKGQAAVAAAGHVVGLEDEAGTDALLARLAASGTARGGVLVKCVKPHQDRRVDLPTVGASTVRNAAAAGLSGIAIEAGAALMVDPHSAADLADQLKLFLIGFRDGD